MSDRVDTIVTRLLGIAALVGCAWIAGRSVLSLL
jgi:hypothetical protein